MLSAANTNQNPHFTHSMYWKEEIQSFPPPSTQCKCMHVCCMSYCGGGISSGMTEIQKDPPLKWGHTAVEKGGLRRHQPDWKDLHQPCCKPWTGESTHTSPILPLKVTYGNISDKANGGEGGGSYSCFLHPLTHPSPASQDHSLLSEDSQRV